MSTRAPYCIIQLQRFSLRADRCACTNRSVVSVYWGDVKCTTRTMFRHRYARRPLSLVFGVAALIKQGLLSMYPDLG